MEEPKVKSNFEDFAKEFYLIPIVVTIISVLQKELFYSIYNIHISTYLELPEILLAFFDNPILIALLLLASFFIIFISRIVYHLFLRKEIEFGSIKTRRALFIGEMLICHILSIGYIVYIYYGNYGSTASLLIGCPAMFAGGLLGIMAIVLRENNSPYKTQIIIRANTYFICVILLFASLMVNYQVAIAENHVYNGSTFVTEKKVYKIDSRNLYLGSTKNYHFLFNTTQNKTLIIPNSEIKEINLIHYYKKR